MAVYMATKTVFPKLIINGVCLLLTPDMNKILNTTMIIKYKCYQLWQGKVMV